MVKKSMFKSECIDRFLSQLDSALQDDSFARLTLSRYKGAEKDLKQIRAQRIELKAGPHLSFTLRYKTRDETRNFTLSEAAVKTGEWIARDFDSATLLTLNADIVFDRRGGKERISRHKPSLAEKPDPQHDRSKRRVIEAAGKPYLHKLGITDAQGAVYKSAQDKYRQINRYIELLRPLIDTLDTPSLKIADMGSGKGYLTFALYDYLSAQPASKNIHVTGIEYRRNLVDLCNKIAGESNFSGLSFVEGAIQDFDAAGLDMLIALHACDTATDDALAKGIRAGCDIIVVAPCCHKQIRREMESSGHDKKFDFLLRHGTFRERQAEMVTDALRALILQYHGYETKAFEFISDAHTPKNVMITAHRKTIDAKKQETIGQQIEDAKKLFRLSHHALEEALKEA